MTEKTANLTIRVRTDEDRAALERLREATNYPATQSKAIWRAIRDHPGLVDDLAEARRELEHLREAIRRFDAAGKAARAAANDEAEARLDLIGAL